MPGIEGVDLNWESLLRSCHHCRRHILLLAGYQTAKTLVTNSSNTAVAVVQSNDKSWAYTIAVIITAKATSLASLTSR